jgi:hypothetical protein
MPLISVTRLRVRSALYFPQFLWDTMKSVRQVQRSNGFLGGRLLVNATRVFWTMTVWTGDAAMNAYRTGGAHRRVMPKLLNWCDEAAVVHWTQNSAEIPSWPEAHQHMLENGRLSKVNHPSPVQESQQIPAPKPSRIAQTLKPPRRVHS